MDSFDCMAAVAVALDASCSLDWPSRASCKAEGRHCEIHLMAFLRNMKTHHENIDYLVEEAH